MERYFRLRLVTFLSSFSDLQLSSASQNQDKLTGDQSSSRLPSSRGFSTPTTSSEEMVPLLHPSTNGGRDPWNLLPKLEDQIQSMQSMKNLPKELFSSEDDGSSSILTLENDGASTQSLRSRKPRIKCPDVKCPYSYSINKDGSPSKAYFVHIERDHNQNTKFVFQESSEKN